jgi:hypothetical protein
MRQCNRPRAKEVRGRRPPGPEPREGGREAALGALDRGICRQGIELRKAWCGEPGDPVAARGKSAGREEKAMSRKSSMHGGGESYSGAVCAEQRVAQEG